MTILRLLGGLCGGLMLLLVGHAQESSAKRDSENIKQRTLGACSSETVRGANSASMIGEIVGFYKEPVSNALLEKDTPTSLRHNYLAISTMQDGSLRIRLSTKERNGHNCGFDSKALLCGQTIYLLPNRDEAEQLGRTGQEPPALLVSKNQIRFQKWPRKSEQRYKWKLWA